MKLLLTTSHKNFFLKNHILECEELFSLEEAAHMAGHLHEGRDGWRSESFLKKKLFSRPLSEIASFLFQSDVIRVAFTQVVFPGGPLATSSYQGIVEGLILNLGAHDLAPPLPQKIGSGVFITPDFVFPPSSNTHLLLIVYGGEKLVYVHRPEDPQLHFLKNLKYQFGDILKNETHPVLYRKNS